MSILDDQIIESPYHKHALGPAINALYGLILILAKLFLAQHDPAGRRHREWEVALEDAHKSVQDSRKESGN